MLCAAGGPSALRGCSAADTVVCNHTLTHHWVKMDWLCITPLCLTNTGLLVSGVDCKFGCWVNRRIKRMELKCCWNQTHSNNLVCALLNMTCQCTYKKRSIAVYNMQSSAKFWPETNPQWPCEYSAASGDTQPCLKTELGSFCWAWWPDCRRSLHSGSPRLQKNCWWKRTHVVASKFSSGYSYFLKRTALTLLCPSTTQDSSPSPSSPSALQHLHSLHAWLRLVCSATSWLKWKRQNLSTCFTHRAPPG